MRRPTNTSYFANTRIRSRDWLTDRGYYHRRSGPAVERSDGAKEWHLDGQFKGSEYGDSQSMIFMHHEFPGYGP